MNIIYYPTHKSSKTYIGSSRKRRLKSNAYIYIFYFKTVSILSSLGSRKVIKITYLTEFVKSYKKTNN